MAILSFLAARRERNKRNACSEAQDWVLRLSEEPDAWPELENWLAADPGNRAAWDEASSVWNGASMLSGLDREDWRAEIELLTGRGVTVRYQVRRAGALAASVALLVFLGWYGTRPDARYDTGIAQLREVTLSDGSHLTVGAKSELETHFAFGRRRTVLNQGQAYFEVAHDADHPFSVRSGDAEVRVTGTRFDVTRDASGVTVAVRDGRVEVSRRRFLDLLEPPSPVLVLRAGQSARLPEGGTAFTILDGLGRQAGSWRSGRFFYHDAPLAEIIGDVRRYSRVPVTVDDPEIGELKVTTSFRVTELDHFLDNLPAVLPIHTVRTSDGAIRLEARGSGD